MTPPLWALFFSFVDQVLGASDRNHNVTCPLGQGKGNQGVKSWVGRVVGMVRGRRGSGGCQ